MMNKLIPGLVLALAALGAGPVLAAQPHMEAALAALQNAKSELEKASNDKGGHRAKSIKAVEAAINQVQKGIEYDRENVKPAEAAKK